MLTLADNDHSNKRKLTPSGSSSSSSHQVVSSPRPALQQAVVMQPLPSPPRSPSIPIPAPNKPKRSSSFSFDSYFQEDYYNGDEDQEKEEYEHLKRMHDLQTWSMYHRIQEHRRRQQEEQKQRNAGKNIGMIPMATTATATTMTTHDDGDVQLQTTTTTTAAVAPLITIPWPMRASSIVAMTTHHRHHQHSAYALKRELSSEELIFGDLEDL